MSGQQQASYFAIPKDDELWTELHNWFASNAKDKEADVLFIGGDHIAMLSQSQFYMDRLAPLHCLCFGSFGDTASNLLWRIQNGEVESFTPRVIVVSIGQSDFRGTEPSRFLLIIKEIVETLKAKQPDAELFFLELIPNGRRENKFRRFCSEVNAKMKEVLDGKATVIGVDSSLIDQNGEIDAYHMFDFFHLSQAGYETVFSPVLDCIREAL